MKVLTLLSGGIDSTVLMFHLRRNGAELKAIGINYGQNHVKELDFATQSAKKANIDFNIIDISDIKKCLLNNSLTTNDEKFSDIGADTIVPNRNMIFLSIAAGYAFSLKYDTIAIAAHQGDYIVYPDCRPAYFNALERALNYGYWQQIKIMTPFINLVKTNIIQEGSRLEVPFELTRSCYKDGSYHCGKCGACIERKLAFKEAGINDPVTYH